MPFRTTNSNPNPPLFYATITPGGGTAFGAAVRGLGITTSNFFGSSTVVINGNTMTQNAKLSEGLYFSVQGSQSFKIYGNSGECGANANRFYLLQSPQDFIPIKNPEDLWIIGSPAGGTLSVRGH
jgi:hypothetical protein